MPLRAQGHPGDVVQQPAYGVPEGEPGNAIEIAQQAVDLVPGVAGEPLVGAFSGQRDLVPAAMDLSRHHQHRRGRGIDDGRFRRADQLRIRVDDVGVADRHDDRPGAEVPGHDGRLPAFVEAWRLDLNGEGRDRLAPNARGDGGDDAGIDATTHIGHDGNICTQSPLDRHHHETLELIHDVLRAALFLTAVRKIDRPVAPLLNPRGVIAPIQVDRQGVSGLQ